MWQYKRLHAKTLIRDSCKKLYEDNEEELEKELDSLYVVLGDVLDALPVTKQVRIGIYILRGVKKDSNE